ncbi:hydroxycarboxylic acid receptor 3 [Salminus brasiliensis]|uniref:hydroxycarboxylic acid receptor 3 n=1 Tax=Salminus brasiliensis TaxID=930266 RepID=UPI003B82EACD
MVNNTTCMEDGGLISSALTPMLILDFILGLPGNVLALWILGFKAPWKPANIYLLNLALADVLLLVGLPFHIDSLTRGGWIFHDSFCRINLFMLSVNQSASIAFMTILVVDRYFRIVHPHHSICHLSIQRVVMISSGVWVAVVALRLPLLVTRLLRSSGNSSVSLCYNIYMWTESGKGMMVHNSIHVLEFVLAFVLVLVCSVRICYHVRDNTQLRRHRRVKRTFYLLLVIVIMFAFCFLPSYITGLVTFFLQGGSSCSTYLVVGKLFSVSLGLAYSNCALDLFLYCLSSACFRDTLKGASNSTGLTRFRLSIKETR